MRLAFAALFGVGVCALFLFLPPTRVLGIGSAAVIVAFAARWLGQCHHRGPLGLLPPVLNADGTRTPAQWYCDRCGESWLAGFDSEPRVVQRFDGYDQSKATDAARRAGDLEKRQRQLALRRAGLEPKARPRPPRNPAQVVPISRVRIAK